MLALGEVQTATLMHSDSAMVPTERVLDLMAGERVRVSERPIHYAVSPQTFTGVDCRIPALSGPQVRGVGTLAGRVLLTGGRVVQGSVAVRIRRGTAAYRRAWSHYLARLGAVETIGRADLDGIGRAHLVADRSASTMGMGGMCGRLLAAVQQSPYLDKRAPFSASRTTLRWVARIRGEGNEMRADFTVGQDGIRTLWLSCGPEDHIDVTALGEDLALHDWLLTALLSMIDRSRIGVDEPAEVVARLRPAVDHLLHQWMPAARLSDVGLAVWKRIELESGLSRQWESSVRRIRDQIAMGAVLLHASAGHRLDASGHGGGDRW